MYTLTRPILDNKGSFASRFPGAAYSGDVGDEAHASRVSDHNPDLSSSKHWVRAQDFHDGGGFDQAVFVFWLLVQLRAGRYTEVQYIISRNARSSVGSVGLFDRRYGFRRQSASGHDAHVHISYVPGFEFSRSTIIEDFSKRIVPPVKKRENMIYTYEVPKVAAWDLSGDNLLGREALAGASFEWVDASSSIPSFGPAVLVVATKHWTSERVELKLEWRRNDGGGEYWPTVPRFWVSGGGQPPMFIPVPRGTYGFALGRVASETSSLEEPVVATLIVETK